MNFFEKWLELDLNPIISFSSKGKITYSNQEAQFLLSRLKQKELFALSLKYAPKNFGLETTYIDLHLKNYTFYAITVRYKDENEIHMKLYKSAMVKKNSLINTKDVNFSNIFALIDLTISTKKINSSINYIKNYDPSIPEFKINANKFIKALNHIYSLFKNSKTITSRVIMKVGEYIKVADKKYSIISIEISSKTEFIKEFNYKDDGGSFIINKDDDKITIDLPLILE